MKLERLEYLLACLAVFLLMLTVQSAQADTDRALQRQTEGRRVALVIGNGKYPDSPLKNPVNDARSMAAKLKELGFKVILKENLGQHQIGSALREFRNALNPGSDALFFYAGHGLQVNGVNYLPAVDAEIESEEDVPQQSINVNNLLEMLDQSKAGVKLVFLDACRNNPYARSFRSTAGGLSKIGGAPSGTLISFATRPGSVAADGDGNHGLYTSQLLKRIGTPNMIVEEVLKRVSSDVEDASGGKQDPWTEGSIKGDFYFLTGTQVASLEAVATIDPVAAAPSGEGVSLADLKKEAEVREGWRKWQTRMQADYDLVAGLDTEPDLKVKAWDRFLASYSQKNPYGDADDTLRARAQRQRTLAHQPVPVPEAVPQAGRNIKDCPDCPEMVVIPAGRFTMGSPAGEADRANDEGPQHEVTLARFSLAKTEVTQGQWKAVMGSNPSHFKGCGDDCPVEKVNWDDAQEYVRKLSEKTGKQYRLPSEAEWEYACRAGEPTRYCGSDDLDSVGWYGAYSSPKGNSEITTNPVGKKQANAWGLYDMSGNVWEWTEDCWNDSYAGAPADGSAWKGGDCGKRMLRGGSWYHNPRGARSAVRGRSVSMDRDDYSGFRPARIVSP